MIIMITMIIHVASRRTPAPGSVPSGATSGGARRRTLARSDISLHLGAHWLTHGLQFRCNNKNDLLLPFGYMYLLCRFLALEVADKLTLVIVIVIIIIIMINMIRRRSCARRFWNKLGSWKAPGKETRNIRVKRLVPHTSWQFMKRYTDTAAHLFACSCTAADRECQVGRETGTEMEIDRLSIHLLCCSVLCGGVRYCVVVLCCCFVRLLYLMYCSVLCLNKQ